MADNIDMTPGIGKTVATDEIGGIHYQRVKVGSGVDGVWNDASASTPIPMSLYDGAGNLIASLPVLGNSVQINASFARPADTTTYTIGDAVSNSTSAPTVLTFTGIARTSGGTGYITKALLATDKKDATFRARLHLFSTAPTAINDNAVQTFLWA